MIFHATLVWFRQLLDPMKKNFFKYRKNSHFAKFAKFRMKTQFFTRQAIPKLLYAFHPQYTGDNPLRVWFDLNNSLTRWKRPILKILFSRNSKVPYELLTFFLGKLYQKYFLLYTLITLVIHHSEFGLIWTTPWLDEKELFLKFAKICNSRNS